MDLGPERQIGIGLIRAERMARMKKSQRQA